MGVGLVPLINEHYWIFAGVDNFIISRIKMNPYTKFGAFVHHVTILGSFALKPLYYMQYLQNTKLIFLRKLLGFMQHFSQPVK